MARDKIDQMYDADELPDEWPVRAIETMPFWGQLFAWLSWRMPLKVYLVGSIAGVVGCFWASIFGAVPWVVAVLMTFLLIWSFFCRTNYTSPWGLVVIQTREPVPGELRQAAREGKSPPPEHPDAAGEART